MPHAKQLIGALVSITHIAIAIMLAVAIVVVKDPLVLVSLFVILSFAFLSFVAFKNCIFTQLEHKYNNNWSVVGYLQHFVDEITDVDTRLPLHLIVFGLGVVVIKYCVIVTMQSLKK